MGNPFKSLVVGFKSKFSKDRNKIEHQQAKVKDTKKETGRSTSGGGKSTVDKVAIANKSHTHTRRENNAITKRRVRRKMANTAKTILLC